MVKTAFHGAKKSNEGIKADTYHEGNGAKLEFERSNGVFELMIELPRSAVEGGAAKVIGAGNVESLQNEQSWNLSRLMCVCRKWPSESSGSDTRRNVGRTTNRSKRARKDAA